MVSRWLLQVWAWGQMTYVAKLFPRWRSNQRSQLSVVTKEKTGNVRTKAVDGTELAKFVHSWAVPASLLST